MSLCFKCCDNPCSCYVKKLERDFQDIQHKLKKAKDALRTIKEDCLTHVDRPWIVDSIRKTLKELEG